MPHQERHPESGKNFRVNLGESVQAIHDTHLHGKLVRLEDWADRLEPSDLSARHIEVLAEFYAHRCHPEMNNETVQLTDLNLDGVVYVTVIDSLGNRIVERALLRMTELESLPVYL